ncbi:MAG TPA: hypothetical protein VLU73_05645 [Methylococcaceae bacterium]|nr:hypothetical protein [Methylococcaceae bacterium]
MNMSYNVVAPLRKLRQLHVRNSILHLQRRTHLYLINRAISRRLSTLVLPKVGADKAFNRLMRPLAILRRCKLSLHNDGRITILCSYDYEMFNKAVSHELSQLKSVVLKESGFSAVADAMHVAPAFLARLTVN